MRTVLPVSPGEMLEEEFLKPLVLCEAVLRKAKRLEEFFFKHLAGRDR